MSAFSDVSARLTWSRALFILFVITVVWTVSMFIAPLTIAPGTFAYTMGGANVIDHWDLYAKPSFNWYAKVIYPVGDAQCHQLWYRSLWINGNQMPIDARMTSLYIFGIFGLLWSMMTPAAVTASEGIANAFPLRIRVWARRIGDVKFASLVILLGLLPVAVDGFTQLFSAYTQYESTNLIRVITGIPGGIVTGLLLGMMIKSIKQIDVEYAQMRAVRKPTTTPPQREQAQTSSGSPEQ
ncbi:MAG TPA: DUF2085 domain-containing protein [Thermoplasmata archaeon]|nr:DUF2085 domain-containing protein [Thermoplasmata archaeon]